MTISGHKTRRQLRLRCPLLLHEPQRVCALDRENPFGSRPNFLLHFSSRAWQAFRAQSLAQLGNAFAKFCEKRGGTKIVSWSRNTVRPSVFLTPYLRPRNKISLFFSWVILSAAKFRSNGHRNLPTFGFWAEMAFQIARESMKNCRSQSPIFSGKSNTVHRISELLTFSTMIFTGIDLDRSWAKKINFSSLFWGRFSDLIS